MGSLLQNICCSHTSADRNPNKTSIIVEPDYNYLTPEEIKKNNEKLNINSRMYNKKPLKVSVINPIYASGIIE